LRLAAHAAVLRVRRAHDAELAREDDLVAPPAEELPDELLVRAHPVDVRRVEEIAAELEGARHHGERLLLVAGPVELRHPHAAEAERRNAGPVVSELPGFHGETIKRGGGRARL